MHFSYSPPPLDASVSGYHHGGHNNNKSYHRNRQNLYQRIPLRACRFDTCTDDYQEEGKEEEQEDDCIMIIQELDSDNSMTDSFLGPSQRIYRHVPSLSSSDCFGSTAPHPSQNDMNGMINNGNTRIEQALSQEQLPQASYIPQSCDDAPQQQHFSIRTSIKRDSWAVDPSPWVVPIAPCESAKRMRLATGYSYNSSG
ncbi:hypothetical protein MHU86_1196 [Fragilaria crotonensis]|nr:hypothetical protein MHU86_1196 [Fragilaria crotonensis]